MQLYNDCNSSTVIQSTFSKQPSVDRVHNRIVASNLSISDRGQQESKQTADTHETHDVENHHGIEIELRYRLTQMAETVLAVNERL